METGNVQVWEAYALHPDRYEVFIDNESVLVELWNGGNIDVNVDGLTDGSHTIEVVVYHISGHWMGNSSTADVEDQTPPSIEGPSTIEITEGESVSEQYTAFDPSGIGGWTIDDTINFTISVNGLLTNRAELLPGVYEVRITVSDIFGHTSYKDVTITVNPVTGGGLPTALALGIGAGGAVIVLVIIAIGYKKRGS